MFCLIILQIILVKPLLYTIACTGQTATLSLSGAFRLKALQHICRRSKDNSTDYLSIIPPSHNGKQQTLAPVPLQLGVHLTPEWPIGSHKCQSSLWDAGGRDVVGQLYFHTTVNSLCQFPGQGERLLLIWMHGYEKRVYTLQLLVR